MRHVERAAEVDRHDVLPVLQHGIAVRGEGVAAVDAGIVDQDRDAPDLVGDLLGDRDAVIVAGDIEGKTVRLAAGFANFLGHFVGGLFVEVEQHDMRAFARVTDRDGAADPGSRTSDDSDMMLEQGHGGFLRF